ncbi:PREDICTED: uncharacterized protein LOC105556204 [Vollenhovia emeryi]|uniref:uncharacterized protein LOC105556204 n=1 Tax=Vollenhovia emeryi TaxID=411798 RepID=UPI0005F46445|nr:PREDICTED: uncharacterized protein LOC105556204 [Vollenhovia emeryi]
MVGTLKRAMDLNSSKQLETELNQFIYTYNYTPCEAAPDHKSPVEIFFGRKLRTPLEMFTPASKPNMSLTKMQMKMKQQFDLHHGTKSRHFVPGQTVVVQLANKQRVSGTFIRKVGKTIAQIRVADKLITRHFNQIWNRIAGPDEKQQAVDIELLLSCQHPDAVRQADAPVVQITPDNPSRESGETGHLENIPTAATGKIARRSSRLADQRRPDYKALGGTRQYRQQCS